MRFERQEYRAHYRIISKPKKLPDSYSLLRLAETFQQFLSLGKVGV